MMLTESMSRIELLVKLLCGALAAHIQTSTMNSIATDAISGACLRRPSVLHDGALAD